MAKNAKTTNKAKNSESYSSYSDEYSGNSSKASDRMTSKNSNKTSDRMTSKNSSKASNKNKNSESNENSYGNCDY